MFMVILPPLSPVLENVFAFTSERIENSARSYDEPNNAIGQFMSVVMTTRRYVMYDALK